MATITTRSGKGSALTHTELDNNFTNLNNDKLEVTTAGTTYLAKAGGTMTGAIVFAGAQATATTATPNIVLLTDSTSSTSITTAATPNSVKTAYDFAVAALPLTGGALTGNVSLTVNNSTTGFFVQQTGSGAALRILQAGTGDALLVEDVSSDTTPFRIDASGNTAIGGTLNKVTITAPATGSTLTIADGKTLTASNTLTFTGTDSSSVAFGTGGTVAYLGNAQTFTGAQTAPSFIPTGSGVPTNGVYLPAANTVGVATNSTGRLFVDASGNVGIGPSVSLGAKLDVNETGTTSCVIRAKNDTTSVYLDANNGYSYLNTFSNHPMLFGTNNEERLRITSTGLVGIGTTAPTGALQVNHIYNASGNAFRIYQPTASWGSTALFNSYRYIRTESAATDGEVKDFHVGAGGVAIGYASTPIYGSGDALYVNGRVGIGTASPAAALDVNGAIRSGLGQVVLDNTSQYKVLDFNHSGVRKAFSAYDNTNNWVFINAEAAGSQILLGTVNQERLRITSAGLVGIGTTSPGARLEVAGSIRAKEGTGHLNISHDGTNGSIVNTQGQLLAYADGANSIITHTNGVERIRIAANGNVGIGTSGPTYRLDVQQGAQRILHQGTNSYLDIGQGTTTDQYAYIDLVGDTTYSDYGLRIIRNNTGANTSSVIQHRGTGELSFQTAEAGALTFYTTNTERARIDSSGRLLVGTSTSVWDGLIEVARVGGSQFVGQRYGANAFPAELNFLKSRSASVGTNTILADGDAIANINFRGADGSSYIVCAQILAAVDGTPGANDMPGRLVFSTTADGAASPTARMTIKSDGKVGIGTTEPGCSLEVTGGIRARGGAPGAQGANNNGYAFSGGSGDSDSGMFSSADGTLEFYINSSEQVRITSAGRVGIGTISPSTALHVAGVVTANGFAFPSIQASQADPNTLDDYEEGTWTPSYSPQSGAFSVLTMFRQNARYIKIGRLVTVSARIETQALTIGTASGNLYIVGLPFFPNADGFGAIAYPGTVSRALNWAGDYPLSVSAVDGITTVVIYYRTAVNGLDQLLNVTDLSTSPFCNEMQFTISYMTDF